MRTKELIKLLQKLVDEHEPHIEIYGEHETSMDVFEKTAIDNHSFSYKGITDDLEISYSRDGCFCLLGPRGIFDET